jgi:hypothetical protein
MSNVHSMEDEDDKEGESDWRERMTKKVNMIGGNG